MALDITKEELGLALKLMKKGKSPGIDGPTVGFYQKFWPIFGRFGV